MIRLIAAKIGDKALEGGDCASEGREEGAGVVRSGPWPVGFEEGEEQCGWFPKLRQGSLINGELKEFPLTDVLAVCCSFDGVPRCLRQHLQERDLNAVKAWNFEWAQRYSNKLRFDRKTYDQCHHCVGKATFPTGKGVRWSKQLADPVGTNLSISSSSTYAKTGSYLLQLECAPRHKRTRYFSPATRRSCRGSGPANFGRRRGTAR